VEAPGTVEQVDSNLVDGLTSIADVIERFGDPGEEMDSATIGGYVAERLERIPAQGDRVPFADYDVTVEAMDGLRVAQVRFVPGERNTSTDADDEASDDST
jgi:CBS domain containing-hemolysin-like protein